MIREDKKQWAIEELKKKNEELGRPPKKSDFDVLTMTRIKSFLGAWPRALEIAGLKHPKHPKQPKRRK
ncbi:MAG: homing endonuclease associated repeat-containing protein [Acutalibacteraceae bacterium]